MEFLRAGSSESSEIKRRNLPSSLCEVCGTQNLRRKLRTYEHFSNEFNSFDSTWCQKVQSFHVSEFSAAAKLSFYYYFQKSWKNLRKLKNLTSIGSLSSFLLLLLSFFTSLTSNHLVFSWTHSTSKFRHDECFSNLCNTFCLFLELPSRHSRRTLAQVSKLPPQKKNLNRTKTFSFLRTE